MKSFLKNPVFCGSASSLGVLLIVAIVTFTIHGQESLTEDVFIPLSPDISFAGFEEICALHYCLNTLPERELLDIDSFNKIVKRHKLPVKLSIHKTYGRQGKEIILVSYRTEVGEKKFLALADYTDPEKKLDKYYWNQREENLTLVFR